MPRLGESRYAAAIANDEFENLITYAFPVSSQRINSTLRR
jgi:hypothetical protein